MSSCSLSANYQKLYNYYLKKHELLVTCVIKWKKKIQLIKGPLPVNPNRDKVSLSRDKKGSMLSPVVNSAYDFENQVNHKVETGFWNEKSRNFKLQGESKNDHWKMAKYSVNHGFQRDKKNTVSYEYLHIAVVSNNQKVLKGLINDGINVAELDNSGNTALHQAAKMGHLKVVEFLLKNGAEIDKKNLIYRQTALHEAVLSGRLDVVKALVKYGANVREYDYMGNTVLHVATIFNDLEMIEFLINNEADIDILNTCDETALHMAARNGCLKAIDYLVKSGAEINKEDDRGDTALSSAIRYSRGLSTVQAVRYLLAAGADLSAKDGSKKERLHLSTLSENKTHMLACDKEHVSIRPVSHTSAECIAKIKEKELYILMLFGMAVIDALVNPLTSSLEQQFNNNLIDNLPEYKIKLIQDNIKKIFESSACSLITSANEKMNIVMNAIFDACCKVAPKAA